MIKKLIVLLTILNITGCYCSKKTIYYDSKNEKCVENKCIECIDIRKIK